jgi:hypothetical protein
VPVVGCDYYSREGVLLLLKGKGQLAALDGWRATGGQAARQNAPGDFCHLLSPALDRRRNIPAPSRSYDDLSGAYVPHAKDAIKQRTQAHLRSRTR